MGAPLRGSVARAMTRRRRAAALLGLALLLGVLAASDVAGREAALRRELGPDGARRRRARAAARRRAHRARARSRCARCPSATRRRARCAIPRAAVGQRAAVAIADAHRSRRLAARRCPAADAEPPGPVLRRGERALDLVAVGAADAVVAGARVDVLVTYDGRAGAPGATRAGAGRRRGAGRPRAAERPTRPMPPPGCRALLATLRVTRAPGAWR